ncbi:class I adenylate-forming enzyme family protein [Actinocorallia sp. B10E7]|uniref:class I adenylate-forming enzyme family protein n=1 Tax=Actinocorallia sp. B10E7 TaxID=3153558 RepID=UPI00325F1DE4
MRAPLDLTGLLDAALAEAADRVVLVDAGRSLTGAQVRRRVDEIASWLRERGAGPGRVVAACQGNHTEAVVLFLAAQRAGAVWAGINPGLGAKEKARLVAGLDPAVLVADEPAETLLGGAPPDGCHLTGEAGSGSGPVERAAADPTAPAAIAFTSGTTSAPKGVVHSGHNLALAALGVAGRRTRPDGPLGSCLPVMVLNIMLLGPVAALLSGRRSVLIPKPSGQVVARWVAEHRVAELGVPPTVIHDLLDTCESPRETLRSLVWLESGGAACTQRLAERYEAATGNRIVRSYGLTEAPGTVCAPDSPSAQVPGASGRPLEHLRLVIRDSSGAPVPAGTSGEICLGARDDGPFAGLYRPMLGYWRSEREAPVVAGELRTGDLGVLDEDGNVRVLGRDSELIIRGGANIAPQEVETALTAHPLVAQASVFGIPDERLGQVVAAAVEVPGPVPTVEELRAHVAAELAWGKAPRYVLAVRTLPRNAAGKIQKAPLREAVEAVLRAGGHPRHLLIDRT